MTATAHALVGGAIAASIPDPALGISLALLSHPLLDMVPHWDFGKGWRNKNKLNFFLEGVFDLSVGLVLSFALFGSGVSPLYFLAVIFASLFFDLIQIPYWFFKWRFPPFSWAYRSQSVIQGHAKLPWGILNQVIAVSGIVIFLKIFH
jgi:hypothetical protein